MALKLFFWKFGAFLGIFTLAFGAAAVLGGVAVLLAFLLWDKADILKEEEKKGAAAFYRVIAVIVAGVIGVWALFALIAVLKILLVAASNAKVF